MSPSLNDLNISVINARRIEGAVPHLWTHTVNANALQLNETGIAKFAHQLNFTDSESLLGITVALELAKIGGEISVLASTDISGNRFAMIVGMDEDLFVRP